MLSVSFVLSETSGETITVPGDYATIQEGLNAAVDGDEVVVSPGTYYENLRFFGRDITLRSVDPLDASIVDSTIIDGREIDSVVIMDRGTVSGFTIRNGAAWSEGQGGGVLLKYAPDRYAEISYNVVSDCAASLGGGINANRGVVHSNTVTGNRAWTGGGIVVAGGLVFNNVVTSNEACCFGTAPSGGGIFAVWSAVIRDNLIIDNYSDEGAGGVLAKQDTLVENNLILDNQSFISGGGVTADGQGVVIRNNLISGNSLLWGSSGTGGGVRAIRATVEGNVIIGNSAGYEGKGGGVYITTWGTLMNNLIAANSASKNRGLGGGVLAISGSLVIGNTIVGNIGKDSDDAGGVFAGTDGTIVMDNIIAFSTVGTGLFIVPDQAVIADYNCVFGNADGDYGGDAAPGDNDINVDPLFVDALGADGIPWTADDNLRLLPDSPCIDAGDPDYVPADGETDLDAHARILCDRLDIGTYEFGIGDFDCDRIVDLFDFAEWEACMTGPGGGPFAEGCEAFDFDGDLDADFEDFGGFQAAVLVP